MNKIALEPEGDEDAEINKIEERGLDSVTTKRGNGKNIWPLLAFGLLGASGLGYAMTGFVPDEAPRPLVSKSSGPQFSTGYGGNDRVPAFQKRLDEEEAVARPEPRVRQAPPVDSGTSTMDVMMSRHRMRMEEVETNARVRAEGERASFDLQRDRAEYERTVEAARRLQKRQAAPALIFDDSKEQD